jgi:hypothetical protein
MSSVSFTRLLNPITLFVFLPITLLLVVFFNKIITFHLDPVVLIAGNAILYLITVVALYFHQKGFADKNPNVFFRAVYASMLLRMFVCIVAVVIYALLSGSAINKYSLLLCFVFYFLYAFIEVRQIFSLLKKPS